MNSEVNLEKGLSLDDIRADTVDLLKEFEWSIVRCTLQAQIYRDLIDYIDSRIKGVENGS